MFCIGRKRTSDKNAKWFVYKDLSSIEYTCCQFCFDTKVKGTEEEKHYKLYIDKDIGLGDCNCDYEMNNTNCNFMDCSIVSDGIRISFMDLTGKRFKFVDSKFVQQKDSNECILILENMGDDDLLFEVNKIIINGETFTLFKNNTSSDILELNIQKIMNQKMEINKIIDGQYSDEENDKMPELQQVNESSKDDNHVNLPMTEFCIEISKHIKRENVSICALKRLFDGTFVDDMGTPWLKLGEEGKKFKIMLDLNMYETENDKSQLNCYIIKQNIYDVSNGVELNCDIDI